LLYPGTRWQATCKAQPSKYSSIALVEGIVELGYLVEQGLLEVRHDLVAMITERRNGGADNLNLLGIG
jgi:hypothetical protein